MIKVEVCINSDGKQCVSDSVSAAIQGGASRIELCSSMHLDGLTPKAEHIYEARCSIKNKASLLVMIRPRKGNFFYSLQELREMQQQIKMVANAGADGVVLGVLRKQDNGVEHNSLKELMEVCAKYKLNVTFHRAFDATPDPLETLELLIDSKVDRILTGGTVWGKNGTALEGVNRLKQIIDTAGNRIEIVIGGGINSDNVITILNSLSPKGNMVSIHAYSGTQEDGITSVKAVKTLVKAVHNFE